MSKRITGVLALSMVATVAFAASAAAALITLDRNPMESAAQRAEVVKLFGSRCQAGGSSTAFRITIGKGTSECAYRTPVVGRDLQISATMRLLSKTPPNVRTKAYLALSLRSGGGGHYQLAVFPLQRKAQLLKVLPDGSEKVLRVAKNLKSVKGVDMANAMRLRAFNLTSGPEKGACKVIAFVGNVEVGAFTDLAAGELQGRASGFAVGSVKNGKGTVGSADDVIVRAPSPF